MAIVRETCPAPACNLVPRDSEMLPAHLAAYHAHFAPAFARAKHRSWAEQYLRGLLSHCERKSIEPMALHLDLPIRTMQHFIGQSTWPTAPVIAQHHQLVGQTLGEADGVLLVDECGVVKQGDDSVGIAPRGPFG